MNFELQWCSPAPPCKESGVTSDPSWQEQGRLPAWLPLFSSHSFPLFISYHFFLSCAKPDEGHLTDVLVEMQKSRVLAASCPVNIWTSKAATIFLRSTAFTLSFLKLVLIKFSNDKTKCAFRRIFFFFIWTTCHIVSTAWKIHVSPTNDLTELTPIHHFQRHFFVDADWGHILTQCNVYWLAGLRMCMCWCMSVWGRVAKLCSLIFWEQQGGVVDPPALFSLQLDLVRFQQLHPLTKRFFVIFPRRTNTTATRRGERKEGRWTVEIERKKAASVVYGV